jgi:hypothetical protein
MSMPCCPMLSRPIPSQIRNMPPRRKRAPQKRQDPVSKSTRCAAAAAAAASSSAAVSDGATSIFHATTKQNGDDKTAVPTSIATSEKDVVHNHRGKSSTATSQDCDDTTFVCSIRPTSDIFEPFLEGEDEEKLDGGGGSVSFQTSTSTSSKKPSSLQSASSASAASSSSPSLEVKALKMIEEIGMSVDVDHIRIFATALDFLESAARDHDSSDAKNGADRLRQFFITTLSVDGWADKVQDAVLDRLVRIPNHCDSVKKLSLSDPHTSHTTTNKTKEFIHPTVVPSSSYDSSLTSLSVSDSSFMNDEQRRVSTAAKTTPSVTGTSSPADTSGPQTTPMKSTSQQITASPTKTPKTRNFGRQEHQHQPGDAYAKANARHDYNNDVTDQSSANAIAGMKNRVAFVDINLGKKRKAAASSSISSSFLTQEHESTAAPTGAIPLFGIAESNPRKKRRTAASSPISSSFLTDEHKSTAAPTGGLPPFGSVAATRPRPGAAFSDDALPSGTTSSFASCAASALAQARSTADSFLGALPPGTTGSFASCAAALFQAQTGGWRFGASHTDIAFGTAATTTAAPVVGAAAAAQSFGALSATAAPAPALAAATSTTGYPIAPTALVSTATTAAASLAASTVPLVDGGQFDETRLRNLFEKVVSKVTVTIAHFLKPALIKHRCELVLKKPAALGEMLRQYFVRLPKGRKEKWCDGSSTQPWPTIPDAPSPAISENKSCFVDLLVLLTSFVNGSHETRVYLEGSGDHEVDRLDAIDNLVNYIATALVPRSSRYSYTNVDNAVAELKNFDPELQRAFANLEVKVEAKNEAKVKAKPNGTENAVPRRQDRAEVMGMVLSYHKALKMVKEQKNDKTQLKHRYASIGIIVYALFPDIMFRKKGVPLNDDLSLNELLIDLCQNELFFQEISEPGPLKVLFQHDLPKQSQRWVKSNLQPLEARRFKRRLLANGGTLAIPIEEMERRFFGQQPASASPAIAPAASATSSVAVNAADGHTTIGPSQIFTIPNMLRNKVIRDGVEVCVCL